MNKIAYWIQRLWTRSLNPSSLSIFEKTALFVLYIAQFPYRFGFWGVQRARHYFSHSYKSKFKVLSIGNISCGGVGKSVVVASLVQELADMHPAIVLRGHKGSASYQPDSVLVSDGRGPLVPVEVSGDEAQMFAQMLRVPVVVGARRDSCAKLLEAFQFKKASPKLLILDDAYQNQSLAKDFEILILDARAPFSNGYCLPAGALREHTLTRADAIIITHANEVSPGELETTRKHIASVGYVGSVYTGRHKPGRVFRLDGYELDEAEPNLSQERVFAFAALGSFEGFLATLSAKNITIAGSKSYLDHHFYTVADLAIVMQAGKALGATAWITTRKDIVKITSLVDAIDPWFLKRIFFIDVEFEFLTTREKAKALKEFKKALKL